MYCLHCKYTTKLRNDKEINAFFASAQQGVLLSQLHQQSKKCTNQAATAPSHRIRRTHRNLLLRYPPTDGTDAHRYFLLRYSPTDCTEHAEF